LEEEPRLFRKRDRFFSGAPGQNLTCPGDAGLPSRFCWKKQPTQDLRGIKGSGGVVGIHIPAGVRGGLGWANPGGIRKGIALGLVFRVQGGYRV